MSAPSTPVSPSEHRFETPRALAEALADAVADALRHAVDTRGEASLVVSGGSTPRPFFDALSTRRLDWPAVAVTLADERWVPPDDAASNQAFVASRLLRGEAASARFVPLWSDAPSVSEGATRAAETLESVPRPFDVVVFGMGGDGHTASLFPGRDAGLAPDDPTVVAVPAPDASGSPAGQPRLSLSLAALLDSRQRFLHITGDEKWRVYRRALESSNDSPAESIRDLPIRDVPIRDLPIRGVLRETVDVYWAPRGAA